MKTPDTMSPKRTAASAYCRIVVLPAESAVSSADVEFGIPVMRTPAGDRLYLSTQHHNISDVSYSGPRKCSSQVSAENPKHETSSSRFNFSDRLHVPIPCSASKDYAKLPEKITTFIKIEKERKRKACCEAQDEFTENDMQDDGCDADRVTSSTVTSTRRSYAEILTCPGIEQKKRVRDQKRKWYF